MNQVNNENQKNQTKVILDEIVNSIPSGVIVLNSSFEVLYFNQRFLALFKLERMESDEFYGQTLHDVLVKSLYNSASFIEFCKHFIESIKQQKNDCLLHFGEQDSKKYYNIRIAEFHSIPDAIIIDVRNYTKQWLREQELIKHERLATLGTMLFGLSHEINNPNAANRVNAENLKLLIELLKSQLFSKDLNDDKELPGKLSYHSIFTKAFQACEDIQFASEKISEIISTLKSHGGAHSELLHNVTVESIVQDAIRLCKHELHKVKFINHTTDSLVYVNVNKTQLTQVMVNLIVNAIHATEEKQKQLRSNEKGTLTVSAEKNLESETVAITVEDNGCGIAENDIAKLFQGDFSTKSQKLGMGLGLWISHRIVGLHEGDIQVKSKKGTGTSFTVQLPVGKPEYMQ